MDNVKFGTWTLIIVLATVVSISGIYYFGFGSLTTLRRKLVVSTTTSLYDTGLLDVIEEHFEAKYPIDIYFISAGTGMAIRYARNGDADMILVHAPSREKAFLEEGFGVCRKIIAYNFFAIVGAEEDPAGIKGLTPERALKKVVEAGREGKAFWVSRGDDSGTHTKEKALWNAAGFDSSELREESWYLESGAGMAKTLQIANEKEAYTLADVGTYLKYHKDRLVDLVVLVGESKELLNVYSAIAVDSAYNPEANFDDAIAFIKFLVSQEGQDILESFGREEYAQSLFYPAVNLLRNNTDQIIAEWIRETAFINGAECPAEFIDDHPELYE